MPSSVTDILKNKTIFYIFNNKKMFKQCIKQETKNKLNYFLKNKKGSKY